MGRDELAACHFPFSRDQTIFTMMCLVAGSTGSPSVTGVVEEGLDLCGFIHIASALFFFSSSRFCHAGRTRRTSDTALFVPASALAQNGVGGMCL